MRVKIWGEAWSPCGGGAGAPRVDGVLAGSCNPLTGLGSGDGFKDASRLEAFIRQAKP